MQNETIQDGLIKSEGTGKLIYVPHNEEYFVLNSETGLAWPVSIREFIGKEIKFTLEVISAKES